MAEAFCLPVRWNNASRVTTAMPDVLEPPGIR